MSTVGACCSGSAVTLPALWATNAVSCAPTGLGFCVPGSTPTYACSYGSAATGPSCSPLHYPDAQEVLSRSASSARTPWEASGNVAALASAALAVGTLTAVPANAFAASEPRWFDSRGPSHSVYDLANIDPVILLVLVGAGITSVLAYFGITSWNDWSKRRAESAQESKVDEGLTASTESVDASESVSVGESDDAPEIVVSVSDDNGNGNGGSEAKGSSKSNGNGQTASLRSMAGLRVGGDISPSMFPPPLPVPPSRASSRGLGVGVGADFYDDPGQQS